MPLQRGLLTSEVEAEVAVDVAADGLVAALDASLVLWRRPEAVELHGREPAEQQWREAELQWSEAELQWREAAEPRWQKSAEAVLVLKCVQKLRGQQQRPFQLQHRLQMARLPRTLL